MTTIGSLCINSECETIYQIDGSRKKSDIDLLQQPLRINEINGLFFVANCCQPDDGCDAVVGHIRALLLLL